MSDGRCSDVISDASRKVRNVRELRSGAVPDPRELSDAPSPQRGDGGELDPASAGPFLLPGFAMGWGWAVESIIIVPELVQIFVFEGCS